MKQKDKRTSTLQKWNVKRRERCKTELIKGKQRLNEKLGRGTETIIPPLSPSQSIIATYGDDMFSWWKNYLFTYSITLTNNKTGDNRYAP